MSLRAAVILLIAALQLAASSELWDYEDGTIVRRGILLRGVEFTRQAVRDLSQQFLDKKKSAKFAQLYILTDESMLNSWDWALL
jgi:hypothetical protein